MARYDRFRRGRDVRYGAFLPAYDADFDPSETDLPRWYPESLGPRRYAAEWNRGRMRYGRLFHDPMRSYARGGEYGFRGPVRRAGYDLEGPPGRFVPDAAYLRHPQLQRHAPRDEDAMWRRRAAQLERQHPDDDELVHAVRESLFRDTWLDADRIQVAAEDGVVTLTGEVDDFLEARYAWDDAWETDGVRGVVNQLTVRVDEPH